MNHHAMPEMIPIAILARGPANAIRNSLKGLSGSSAI